MNTTIQQDQPQPGKAYSLLSLSQHGTWAAAELKTTGLPLGARVSYGDMANPRKVYVIVQEKGGTYGQKAIREDGQNANEVSQSSIDGPGGWRREQGLATADEIEHLRAAHAAHMEQSRTAAITARLEREEGAELGRKLLAERMPAGSQAVIIAELEQDDCDIMTDYFATKPMCRVILAFSPHKRDLFAEMRKAAALLPETTHLVTAGPEAEHREKYSMGGGYYLKAGSSYSTGWNVSKTYLDNAIDVAGQPDGWAPHFTAAPVAASQDAPTTAAEEADAIASFEGRPAVRFNAEKCGLEIAFQQKPAAAVLDTLKRHGWRWSRFNSCWYQRATDSALNAAAQVANLTPAQIAALASSISGEHRRLGDAGMEAACGIA